MSSKVQVPQTTLREKVAELCGWHIRDGVLFHNDCGVVPAGGNKRLTPLLMGAANVPDYPKDLNAIHEAILAQEWGENHRDRYMENLHEVIFRDRGVGGNSTEGAFWTANATAEQRCRAFIATMEATSVQKRNEVL